MASAFGKPRHSGNSAFDKLLEKQKRTQFVRPAVPGIAAGEDDILLSNIPKGSPGAVPYSEADGNRALDDDGETHPHHHIVWMVATEFLATLLYATISTLSTSLSLSFLYQALAQGAALMLATAIGLAHSGAHLNPYITLLLTLMGKFHIWYALLYALVVHPAAYAAGAGIAVGISPAPLLAAVPYSLSSMWRVGIYEGLGTLTMAAAVAWSIVSPESLRMYPQPLPNHNGVALVPFSAPALIGMAYLATAIPGLFVSGSVYNGYRYLFTALYAGVLDVYATLAYFFGPLAGVLVAYGGYLLIRVYMAEVHRGSRGPKSM